MGIFDKRIEKYERQLWNDRAVAIHTQLKGTFQLGFLRDIQCGLEANPYSAPTHVGLVLGPLLAFVPPEFQEHRPRILVYQHLREFLLSEAQDTDIHVATECNVAFSSSKEDEVIQQIIVATTRAFMAKGMLTQALIDDVIGTS
jgi:hypothetical protein